MSTETPTLVSWFMTPKAGTPIQRPWLRRTILGLLVVGLAVMAASLVADLVGGRVYPAVDEARSAGVLLLLGPQILGWRPVNWLLYTLVTVIVGSLVVGAWQAWTGG